MEDECLNIMRISLKICGKTAPKTALFQPLRISFLREGVDGGFSEAVRSRRFLSLFYQVSYVVRLYSTE